MKLLVIGSGGREHALAWKLAQTPAVQEVLVAPGNAGTATEPRCRNVAVAADDLPGLLALAQREAVALTVVGPEGPLSLGVVDAFTAAGLRIFGPTQAAAQLEASKAFTKGFLERHRIPTAGYAVFTDAKEASDYVARRGAPIVVKADGLAAGKGVVMAAEHYPNTPAKGDVIDGLDADFGTQAKVFHAGTTLTDGKAVTAGGRVLCVVGKGADIRVAQSAAYAAVKKIRWRGEFHRSDIGWRAIERLP